MAPIELSPSLSQDDDSKVLTMDASILKALMSQQHDRHVSTDPIPLECDIHAGCHRAHSATGEQSQRQQHIPPAGMEQTSLSSEEYDHNDYEQLKELYRNCHHSAENRYSHLLDCAHRDHRDHEDQDHQDRDHHPNSYYHILRIPEKDAKAFQQKYYSTLSYPSQTQSSHSFMLEFGPTAVTLVLILLLLVAMMLVEMVEAVHRLRNSSLSSSSSSSSSSPLDKDTHDQPRVRNSSDVQKEKALEEECV